MLLTATVLRVRPHREHDRLYTIYTKERGKLTILGAGTQKITSKLAGHLGPFVVSQIDLVSARSWEKLIHAEVLEVFSRLTEQLQYLGTASYLLELVDALTKENHPDIPLWDLLIAALFALNTGTDVARIRDTFVNDFLAVLGYQPPLQQHLLQPLKTSQWLAAAKGFDGQ